MRCKGYYDYITHRRFVQFKKRIDSSMGYSRIFHRCKYNHRLFKRYFGESIHMNPDCKYKFKETVKYRMFLIVF